MFKRIAAWAQGRHTLFAIYFAVSGTVLEIFHRLDGNFIALIAAVQGFVFAHSIQENHFNVNANTNITDVVKDVTKDVTVK